MGYACPYSLREIQAVENASAEAGFNTVTAAILEETARILGARHSLEDVGIILLSINCYCRTECMMHGCAC